MYCNIQNLIVPVRVPLEVGTTSTIVRKSKKLLTANYRSYTQPFTAKTFSKEKKRGSQSHQNHFPNRKNADKQNIYQKEINKFVAWNALASAETIEKFDYKYRMSVAQHPALHWIRPPRGDGHLIWRTIPICAVQGHEQIRSLKDINIINSQQARDNYNLTIILEGNQHFYYGNLNLDDSSNHTLLPTAYNQIKENIDGIPFQQGTLKQCEK